jgi:hypothetical protein
MPLASQSIQAEITSTPASQTGGQDPSIVFTAAAQTIEAELTRLAPSPLSATPIIPPTLISIPTKTIVPSATTVPLPCNRVSYNAATIDVTIPDWQVMPPGQVFTKTWRLTNAGTCTWTPAYRLAFYQGDTMGVPTGYAQSLTSGNIPPGGTVDVSVNLTAPVTPGTYKGYWHMQEPGGQYFGIGATNGGFYVAITVPSPVPAFFAVTSVSLSVSGGCGAFHIVANITTNGAGTVTYRWIRSDGGVDMAVHPALDYASAGTQSVSTDWSSSAPGAKWMDIYIDTPNHQQFGRADFSCP